MFSPKILSGALWLALIVAATQPVPAHAAQSGSVPVQVQTTALTPGKGLVFGYLQSWIGNRKRMIQVALVAVGLGIFILHGSKKL